MKNVLQILKFYKTQTILAPTFKLLEAIFDLLIPIIVSLIIDKGISNVNNSYVLKMCGLLILFAILGVVVSVIAQYFAAKASIGLGTTLREKMFEKIQDFSFKNLDKIQESSIINRISNDTWQVQTGVNLFLRLALRSPFIVFGSFIMAFLIDPKCGSIFAMIIPIIIMITFFITKICVPEYEKIQSKKDAILNRTKDTLQGTRVIRAFGIEEKMVKEFENANLAYTKGEQKTSKIASLNNPLNYVVVNFGIIAILIVGGTQVNFGVLSQGQVVALYQYMAQILIELVKLTNLLLLFPKTVASAKRIEELLNTENSMKNGKELLEDENVVLKFENVSLNYTEAGQATLKNISFEAKTGEWIGIIGGTGSGKSSIVNLIPRFYDVTSGQIKINGKNIKDYDWKNLRKNIGIVMQNKALFKGSIRENLERGNGNLEETQIENALEIAQAKEFVEKKKDGINEMIEENGKNLSGGQKQRLTIARAIAKNPKLLILDDSMSALDLATDKKLREKLKKFKKDKLLIMVSQRISSIQNLDKILVVDHGEIVGQGNHQELLENCEIYREIYDSQTKKEGK